METINGYCAGPFVHACDECALKVINLPKAQTFFKIMFRTSHVLSSALVAENIGACLAQNWTVEDIRKQRVWNMWRYVRPR